MQVRDEVLVLMRGGVECDILPGDVLLPRKIKSILDDGRPKRTDFGQNFDW